LVLLLDPEWIKIGIRDKHPGFATLTGKSLTRALANIFLYYVFSLKLDPGLEQACQKDLQKFCSNRADVEAVECLKENPTNRKLINSTKNRTNRSVNPTKFKELIIEPKENSFQSINNLVRKSCKSIS
jgi:hypothetical protein